MKICFVGLGSIGQRHLKNFILVAKDYGINAKIHALRSSDKELPKEIAELVAKEITLESGLDHHYDIVFITNPTSEHFTTIKQMAGRTRNMFIEKPLAADADFLISDLGLSSEGVYYIAGPLRYSGVIKKLKELLQEERVYSIRAICSSYLPDWRPETDYRQSYSAQTEKGGGAAIDLIHEWDYITELFGFPEKACRLTGKCSHLEIDSEDIAVYIAGYRNMLAEIHLDYFGRKPRRSIELLTEKGMIAGDLIRGSISFTDGRRRLFLKEERNDIYLREMKFFMELVLREENYSNLEKGLAILKLALGKAGE